MLLYNITSTFTYDGNGNVTSDSHKGITISYNYLDLPDTVSKGSSKLVFTYDAAGNKLYKQLIVSGTVVSQKHYVENLEVVAGASVPASGIIESVAMDEGRIVHTDSGYRYEYWLTDHLGNNRVAFRTRSNGSVQLSQVQNYYPFGSDMGDSTMNYSINPNNFYKYSNKELQPELDLDTYDFGARHYDAVLGRWMGIDPLASISDDESPYNYAGNNPMNMVDPDGMQYGTGTGGAANSLQDAEPIVTKTPTNVATGGSNWWNAGGSALSAGVSLYNAWNAFSFKDPMHLNMNFGGVQGNSMKPATLTLIKGGLTGNELNATFQVNNVRASGLQIIQTFYGSRRKDHLVVGKDHWTSGKTKYDAFVDGGKNSPYVTISHNSPAHPTKPYYLEPGEVRQGVNWNKTSGTIQTYDRPGAIYATDMTRFETMIIAINYNGSGKDKILGAFKWGWNSFGTKPTTGAIKLNSSASPIAIQIINYDYPSYKLFK